MSLLFTAYGLLLIAFCIPATNKVNYFNLVAITNFRLLPISAPDDLPIHLNSNSLGRER